MTASPAVTIQATKSSVASTPGWLAGRDMNILPLSSEEVCMVVIDGGICTVRLRWAAGSYCRSPRCEWRVLRVEADLLIDFCWFLLGVVLFVLHDQNQKV